MHLDLFVAAAGLFVGFAVGLTGMGGGALMTPMLVLFFHVQPLAAVSSDLVASFVMKPIGGMVHLRHGTVHRDIVRYLMLGSIPSAFTGVLLLKSLGDADAVQNGVRIGLGIALMVAVGSLVFRAFLHLVRRRNDRLGRTDSRPVRTYRLRPVPTVLVGALGGLVVGMTSVGSGSLIIIMLLMLYPALKMSELVGTDLVQAVPLVGAAALGHILFGSFQMSLTASLLVGSIPGVYLGARASAIGRSSLVRRALMLLLFASGLKLLQVESGPLAVIVLVVAVAAPLAWSLVRQMMGEPRGAAAAAAPTQSKALSESAVG